MFYLEQGLTGEALEEHQELGEDAVNEGQEVETEVGQRRQTRHGCTFLFGDGFKPDCLNLFQYRHGSGIVSNYSLP